MSNTCLGWSIVLRPNQESVARGAYDIPTFHLIMTEDSRYLCRFARYYGHLISEDLKEEADDVVGSFEGIERSRWQARWACTVIRVDSHGYPDPVRATVLQEEFVEYMRDASRSLKWHGYCNGIGYDTPQSSGTVEGMKTNAHNR